MKIIIKAKMTCDSRQQQLAVTVKSLLHLQTAYSGRDA
jgi:hypothetical protein